MGLLKEQYTEQRRYFYCIVAIGSTWKLVGSFWWMLHLLAERHRSIDWWEHALWKTFWATISRTYYSIWFIGWVWPYNSETSVPNPSIWKEIFTWIVPRIRIVRGENLEGWRPDRRPWGVGDDGRIENLLQKTQCERGDISPKRRIYFSDSRWTNQNSRRRAGTENIHLDTAATKSRRGSHWLSWRIRRIFSTTSWLTSGCRWSNERLLVHVRKLHIPPSRWTTSRTLLAERGITPNSTEVHWRNQNYSDEFGCQAGEAPWWLLEHWWLSRLVWFLDRFHTIYSTRRKCSWRIYVVQVEINRKTAYIQTRSYYGQNSGNQWESTPSWRRSKSGLRKTSSSKTHEIFEESVSSTLKIRNSKEPSRTRVRSWKHQWLLLCVLELWIIVGVMQPTKLKPNLCVFWKLINLQECVWEIRYCIIMKTILQEKVKIHYSTTTWFTNLCLCLKLRKFWQRKQRWRRNGKIGENFGVEPDESESNKDVIDEANTSGATVHFVSFMDIRHLINAELESKHQKYQGRVVLRGFIVKEDSGSYAVFTEQGSSVSQMTAAKIMETMSRLLGLRWTSTRSSIRSYTS